MLSPPIPAHLTAALDRAVEVARSAADVLEFDPSRDGPPRALRELRAAIKVVDGLLEAPPRNDREFLSALQTCMAARTIGEVITAARKREPVK